MEYSDGSGGVQTGNPPQSKTLGLRGGPARHEEGQCSGPDDTSKLRHWRSLFFRSGTSLTKKASMINDMPRGCVPPSGKPDTYCQESAMPARTGDNSCAERDNVPGSSIPGI